MASYVANKDSGNKRIRNTLPARMAIPIFFQTLSTDLEDTLADSGFHEITCAPRPPEARLRGRARILVWQTVAFVLQVIPMLIGSV